MEGASEADLMLAVRGDRPALSRLLQVHAASLAAQLAERFPRRCAAAFTIDDVLQQTFTDAFLAITQFEPRGPGTFLAWLVTLGRRNLQDAIRLIDADKRGGGRVRPAVDVDSDSSVQLFERLSGSDTTPSRHAARAEMCGALRHALQALPEPHRRVVQLVDLEEQAVERVAEILGRSAGAVYMLRSRAHRWLQELLGRPSQFLSSG